MISKMKMATFDYLAWGLTNTAIVLTTALLHRPDPSENG